MTDNNQPTDIYYSTGETILDQKLGGRFSDEKKGIPGGSIVLVYGPPESNLSTLFAQKMLLNLLEENPNSRAYYMHSSRPQHVIIKEFHAYNWHIDKFQQTNRWNFIDMWDITSSHVASSSKIGKIDIRRKTYLKQAFKKMEEDYKTNGTTCFSVIDNLLWLKEDEFDTHASKLLDFFKELTDIIVNVGGVHFFVLPKGILVEIAQNIIISMANGIIEFSREIIGNKNQDRISIVKMMGVSYESEVLDITPDQTVGLRIESTGKL